MINEIKSKWVTNLPDQESLKEAEKYFEEKKSRKVFTLNILDFIIAGDFVRAMEKILYNTSGQSHLNEETGEIEINTIHENVRFVFENDSTIVPVGYYSSKWNIDGETILTKIPDSFYQEATKKFKSSGVDANNLPQKYAKTQPDMEKVAEKLLDDLSK